MRPELSACRSGLSAVVGWEVGFISVVLWEVVLVRVVYVYANALSENTLHSKGLISSFVAGHRWSSVWGRRVACAWCFRCVSKGLIVCVSLRVSNLGLHILEAEQLSSYRSSMRWPAVNCWAPLRSGCRSISSDQAADGRRSADVYS